MKSEVGMYVRTKNGNIRKIVELTNTKFIDEPDYYVDKVLIDIEQNEREDTIYMEKWLFNDDIIKASYNITDLISRFDLVNGYLVICKMYEDEKDIPTIIKCVGDYYFKEEDIKSVITHEQMEQMAYKVEE